METAAGQGVGDQAIPTRIVDYPARFQFQDPERNAVGDHVPDGLLAGVPVPFNDRMGIVGEPQRSLGPQPATSSPSSSTTAKNMIVSVPLRSASMSSAASTPCLRKLR